MGISPFYIILVMIAGVLIFGKDLPDVMRKLGNALMEFRKGMNEISANAVKGKDNSKSSSAGVNSGKFESPLVEVCESDENATFADNKFEPPA
ncbi:MAG: twin-arginine translocase TatA/TatE family subunit [Planctomycetaceae bacterium]|jgi:TatA/E family protein of Tat protein translocase|nr:twin-arginine translocase TatA/TatE family subunit [Planctomycetaceae bacterium]